MPVGPEVRQTTAPRPSAAQAPPSPEQIRQLMEDTVAGQFKTITAAARDCDVLVAGMSLQFALQLGGRVDGNPLRLRRLVSDNVCHPQTMRRPHCRWQSTDGTADNRTLWARQAKRWNDLFGPAINPNRASSRLGPGHRRAKPHLHRPAMAGRRPDFGAMDRDRGTGCRPDGRMDSCGPAAIVSGTGGVPQRRRATGLLRLRQHARSSGSQPGNDQCGACDRPPCDRVSWVGRRGTAGQRTRLPVHRGGKPAGALQASRRCRTPRWRGNHDLSAQAGAPQVVVPQIYDQHYWAQRVQHLGIGTAHAPGAPTADSLTEALSRTLHPDVASVPDLSPPRCAPTARKLLLFNEAHPQRRHSSV